MQWTGGTAVNVETNPELIERFLVGSVVMVHDLLWSFAFLLSSDRNRHAVLVGTADEEDLLASKPKVACIEICGQVRTSDVTKVDVAICVG